MFLRLLIYSKICDLTIIFLFFFFNWGQADPVGSCHVWFCSSADTLKDRKEWSDVTTDNIDRKSSFFTLCCRGGVFWSECLMVSKTSQSQGCELRAEWSSLSHCQNIHSSTLMYPHTLTSPNLWQMQLWNSLWWIRSGKLSFLQKFI